MVMEEGLAHIYLVSNGNMKQKGKVEVHIPKKKAIDTKHFNKKDKFHYQCELMLDKLCNPALVGPDMLDSIKAFVIGSPGSHK